VLTNELGGMAEPRQLSRVWSGWARRAGIKDRGTHVGRHFAATTLLASGRASVADVAQMLGHNPSVLLDTYASAIADGQRAAADVLGSALSAAT
jgi:integrase